MGGHKYSSSIPSLKRWAPEVFGISDIFGFGIFAYIQNETSQGWDSRPNTEYTHSLKVILYNILNNFVCKVLIVFRLRPVT